MDSVQHKEFMRVTYSRFAGMEKRFGELPFTLDRYREFIIDLLGVAKGTTRCEYCNTPLDLLRLQLDHRIPPAQGGCLGFDNLAPACEACNQQKGQLTAFAFMRLLELVNDPRKFTEVDRTDLLERLQSQLRLAMREQARLAELWRKRARISPVRHSRPARSA